MKMTQTPLDNKIKILSDIHLDYRKSEDNEWSDFVDFYEDEYNKDDFALAFSIVVGYATPTERGIEVLEQLFDELCEHLGVTEDRLISHHSELFK